MGHKGKLMSFASIGWEQPHLAFASPSFLLLFRILRDYFAFTVGDECKPASIG
jgi:hypothetical protein